MKKQENWGWKYIKNIQECNIAWILLFFILFPFPLFSQSDSIPEDFVLDEIVVRSAGTRKLTYGSENRELISAVELTRAACCSLGESFTTNPSVDVNYADAATGTKQIKLLGLSGSYIQMMNENVPNFRGVSSLYSLDYIPGPWIQSIQVSKGASSVKNGFESLTGQINVELKKPQAEKALNVNAYFDSDGRGEINGNGNLHFGQSWSGGLMVHASHSFWQHDGNDDGFIDMPKIDRLSLLNRWAYLGENYVFQIYVKGLLEKRKSGQIDSHHQFSDPYIINIFSKRLEFFTKNAFIFNKDNGSNLALILAGNVQDFNSSYGKRKYDALEYNVYANLIYERNWGENHTLSTGASWQYDIFRQHFIINPVYHDLKKSNSNESVAGIYAQYTFNHQDKIILMGGLRFDYSNLYGSFVTPRLHTRYNPSEDWSIHASIGTGRRSPHILAEYNYLLASSRSFVFPDKLRMEVGMNTGLGFTFKRILLDREFEFSAEYYFTKFYHQLTADFNSPHEVIFSTDSRSYGHSLQLEASYQPIEDMSVKLAYRYIDVMVNYGHGYQIKPLSSRHRGLLTVGYNPFMGKWQFDATLSVMGGGKMPTPYKTADGNDSWEPDYPAFCSLNFQVTRNFRHWSVYLGGENLTNYRQKNPIISASDPWSKDFDATMIWGPLNGIMGYIGFRVNF